MFNVYCGSHIRSYIRLVVGLIWESAARSTAKRTLAKHRIGQRSLAKMQLLLNIKMGSACIFTKKKIIDVITSKIQMLKFVIILISSYLAFWFIVVKLLIFWEFIEL